jgi:hypothetical protein
MSPQRRIIREAPLDLEALRKEVSEWSALKTEISIATPQVEERRKRLQTVLQKYGEVEPEKGHLILDLEGQVGEIAQLKNLRRDSQVANGEAIEEILRDKGMWEERSEVIRVPDESRIHAAYLDKRITDDELAQMFRTTTSWALFALDENGKPVKI